MDKGYFSAESAVSQPTYKGGDTNDGCSPDTLPDIVNLTATTFLSSKEHSCPSCTQNREKLPLREQKSHGSTRLLDRECQYCMACFRCKGNARILLVIPLQSSRSTFSRGNLFSFLPSKKACRAHQFQYLGVDQQYPPVISTRAARGSLPSMARAETQCINQRRVGG